MKKPIKKGMHEGHRMRLRAAAEKDPELETFSDFETLEYLLSFVIPRKDTNAIAHELIDTFGSLYGVLSATSNELYEVPNMTMLASSFLPNLFSVVRRAEISRVRRSFRIDTVRDSIEAFRPYFLGRNQELFYMMMLDVNERVISIDCLSKGVANYTAVDMSTIAAKTSRSQACKVILAHNHPGGNLQPSNEDLVATSSIAHLLNSMGKELMDHLIFVGDHYFSFFENEHMNKHIKNADKVFGTNKYMEVQRRLFVDKYVREDKLPSGEFGKTGDIDGVMDCDRASVSSVFASSSVSSAMSASVMAESAAFVRASNPVESDSPPASDFSLFDVASATRYSAGRDCFAKTYKKED